MAHITQANAAADVPSPMNGISQAIDTMIRNKLCAVNPHEPGCAAADPFGDTVHNSHAWWGYGKGGLKEARGYPTVRGRCEGVQLIPIDKVADTSILGTVQSNRPYEVGYAILYWP
ncbi:hypothetical protein FOZ63_030377 [Perkinsus olseni]|uniref:Uncharacterized protein n=2 Tax=Perkinsus olseni TaxID=32597 RepID=A0A7J6U8E4_PEROL|nr:hypothetical protein FOZ63_030377 [Perkinsus olseni]